MNATRTQTLNISHYKTKQIKCMMLCGQKQKLKALSKLFLDTHWEASLSSDVHVSSSEIGEAASEYPAVRSQATFAPHHVTQTLPQEGVSGCDTIIWLE